VVRYLVGGLHVEQREDGGVQRAAALAGPRDAVRGQATVPPDPLPLLAHRHGQKRRRVFDGFLRLLLAPFLLLLPPVVVALGILLLRPVVVAVAVGVVGAGGGLQPLLLLAFVAEVRGGEGEAVVRAPLQQAVDAQGVVNGRRRHHGTPGRVRGVVGAETGV
jgi:hypothetical protein